MIPDWLLAFMAALSLCALVLGRWRWALWLAMPALTRFVLWPLFQHYLSTISPILLVLLALAALPFILLRVVHRLLSLTISERSADEAIGSYMAHLLIGMTRRRGSRRRSSNERRSISD